MLSTPQLNTLRAAVFADATALPLLQAGNDAGLRAYLNSPSTFVLWRDAVSQDEIMQNGFDWTRADNLSVGAARVWEWLFSNSQRQINPSKPNVRAGIDAVWKGTAADLAVRAAVYAHCKRLATVAEKMLTGGTGTDASPATASWSGEVGGSESAQLIWHDDGTPYTQG